jgi:hypothetical protein
MAGSIHQWELWVRGSLQATIIKLFYFYYEVMVPCEYHECVCSLLSV